MPENEMSDEVFLRESRELANHIAEVVGNNDAEIITSSLCEVLAKVICVMADRLDVPRDRILASVIPHLIDNVRSMQRKQ